MDSLDHHTINGIPVIQNKQDFVIGVFTIQEILRFTKYTSRFIVGYDEEEVPIYNEQIQRSVENSRVEKIADFLINDPDATFPTNLVLHIPKQAIEKQKGDDNFVKIYLWSKVFDEVRENRNIYITIIDGQHRIKGIEVAIARLYSQIDDISKTLQKGSNKELEGKRDYYSSRLTDLLNIKMVVSFFIDKTLEYQAMIFSTINRTQKRVSQSLVYSLFGLDTGDTPQKTALQAVLTLNGRKESPFYKRIKLYGGEYSKDNSPPLSQATMVRSIVHLICENLRESENDRYRKRKDLLARKQGSSRFLPFRVFYAKGEDSKISDILFYYFSSIQKNLKDKDGHPYWNFRAGSGKPENIFHTTVGYDSLLKILVDILQTEPIGDVTDTVIFDKYVKRAKVLEIENVTRYSFNQRGKRILYLDMSLAIWPPAADARKDDDRVIELAALMQLAP